MSRENKVYVEDVLTAVQKIEHYVKGMSFAEFSKNELVTDAVVRNLEIIGEAAKSLSAEFKTKHAEIEWKKIAGLRDILIHAYFGVNLEILWDVVQNKLPELKRALRTTS